MNRSLLLSLGVPQGSVDVAPDCTVCRTDLYFSHRAEKGKTGRMAAVIARRSDGGQSAVTCGDGGKRKEVDRAQRIYP